MPGKYFLKIAIGDGLSDIDVLENIYGFTIRETDIWESGKLPNQSQGVIIQPASWEMILE